MKLTELLAMPIIDLRTAAAVGVVSGFVADDKLRNVVQCIVIDDNTYAEELLYPWSALRAGTDAYCVAGARSQPIAGVRVPFKGMIYTTDGVRIGMLQDVECTSGGKVQNLLLTDGSSIDPAQIYKVGEVIMLKGTRKLPRTAKSSVADNTAQPSVANPLPQPPTEYFAVPHQDATDNTQPAMANQRPAAERGTTDDTTPAKDNNQPATDTTPVSGASADRTDDEAASAVQTVTVPPNGVTLRTAVMPIQQDVPYRLVTDYDFLLGRTLTKDLVQSGHVFIAKGTVIDKQAVQLAGRAGLLVALTTISR